MSGRISDSDAEIAGGSPPKRSASPRGRGHPVVHGLTPLRRTLSTLTTKRLDGRSALAVAVRKWKAQVAADLGGALSEAQETILESAAQKLVIRDSLGDYIARQGSLVSKKRTVAPVVTTYLTVADSLARDLERLGLERREHPVPTLDAYIATRQTPRRDGGGDASEKVPSPRQLPTRTQGEP